jgi:hypothetical protein
MEMKNFWQKIKFVSYFFENFAEQGLVLYGVLYTVLKQRF